MWRAKFRAYYETCEKQTNFLLQMFPMNRANRPYALYQAFPLRIFGSLQGALREPLAKVRDVNRNRISTFLQPSPFWPRGGAA